MSDYDDAVSRLTARVRQYGDTKPRVFIGDVTMVLLAAQDAVRLQAKLAAAEALLREVRDAKCAGMIPCDLYARIEEVCGE